MKQANRSYRFHQTCSLMAQWLMAIGLIANAVVLVWNSTSLAPPPEVRDEPQLPKILPQNHPNGWSRPDVVFGHVHIARTVGSDIVGELSARYERVCANKGYSYDAFRVSRVFRGEVDRSDIISNAFRGSFRGNVPLEIMDEIGYEDCDYISIEKGWQFWNRFTEWPMEIHVPCRDPVDHLMSTCNYRWRRKDINKLFDCSSDQIQAEINKCLLIIGRFAKALGKLPNVTLKCFDPLPLSRYLDFMGTQLQPRRLQTTINRSAYRPKRNRTEECIWQDDHLQQRVREKLVQGNPYYRWCDKCMTGDNNLFRNYQQNQATSIG